MTSVLCVSAFRDIRRGEWAGRHAQWKRTNENYIEWFLNLAQAPIDLVVFCDDPTVRARAPPHVRVLPYDEADTMFRYLAREREVMADPGFQSLVAHRVAHPEHSIPEYNLVQHSKTSFVRRASQLFPGYTHYAWVDFGYVREPRLIPREVVWDRIATDRITYAAFVAPTPDQIPDPARMCVEATSFLQGSMFILPAHLASWYEKAYEEILCAYQAACLADDDQALALQVYKRHPERFRFLVIPEWFAIFRTWCRP